MRKILDSLRILGALIDRRLPFFFVVIYLIAGVTLAVFVPAFHGLDESAHFNRAYQIAEGGMRSVEHEGRIGGSIPKELAYHQQVAHARIKDKTDVTYEELFSNVYSVHMSSDPVFISYPGGAAYSPFTYIPASAALALTKDANFTIGFYVLITRISMLFAFIALAYSSLRLVNGYKIKWLVLAFLFIPNVVFQASVLSADTLTLALSVMIFTLLYVGLTRKENTFRYFALATVSASLLSLIKFNYFPLALLVLLLPISKDIVAVNYRKLHATKGAVKLIALIVITVPTLVWNLQVMDFASGNNKNRQVASGYENSISGQIDHMIDNPVKTITLLPMTMYDNAKFESVDYVNRLIGHVGYNAKRVPTIVTVNTVLLLILALLYATPEIKRRIRVFHVMSILVAGLISALSVFLVLYLTFSDIGGYVVQGVQGRYFLPVFLFLLPLLVYLINGTLRMSVRRLAVISIAISISNTSLLLVYYLLVTYRGV